VGRSLFRKYAQRLRGFLLEPLLARPEGPRRPDAATQVLLTLAYRELRRSGAELPSFRGVGFQAFSQADEDGILLYIFSQIGAESRIYVEICAGDGRECNTTNLLVHHRWTGLLVDGDDENVRRGVRYFGDNPSTYVYPPRFVHAWVTRENVNSLAHDNDFRGEIDLLSLDVDGVDYWLWEALDAVTPRVVVLEYNDILGPHRSCTVPYAPDFRAGDYPMTDGMPNFAGASLPAFVKLGARKGYRLVGCNAYGYNAFFVRQGVGEGVLPEVAVESCFTHPKVIQGMKERYPTVQHLPWVEV
jgi:hypothetical protein